MKTLLLIALLATPPQTGKFLYDEVCQMAEAYKQECKQERETIKIYTCLYCGERTPHHLSQMCDTCYEQINDTERVLDMVVQKTFDYRCDGCRHIDDLANGKTNLLQFVELCEVCEDTIIERAA